MLLLLSVILLYKTLNVDVEAEYYEQSNLYIYAESSPVFVENEVLSSKEEPTGVKKTGVDYYRELVEQYEWNTDVAMAVMREESSYNPSAINREGHKGCRGSYGLMQIAGINLSLYLYHLMYLVLGKTD